MERKHLAALAAIVALACAPAAVARSCDRPCMTGVLDSYLAAMMRNDPGAAPITRNLRGTENGHEVKTGEGLWRSLRSLDRLQRRYVDPDQHQAAYYGLVIEGTEPALLSLRLRFDGDRISESEAIIARKGEMLFNPDGVTAFPPPPEQTGRSGENSAAMIATATAYFDALQGGDPLAVPKVDGCERIENGTNVTRRAPSAAPGAGYDARGDCTAGLNTFPISKVAHRRFPVIDSQAGVILGVGLFQRPPGAKWRDGSPRKRNLIHEYFALDGGRITRIFAVMHYIEQDEPDATGW